MFSNFGQYMTEYWSQIWRIFQVELPYLGLTTGQLLLGNFVVALSIRIWKNYFGLPSLFESSPRREKRYTRKDNKNALPDR